MLRPREADLPAFLLVFIVLPLVAYILLGKWNETVTKKARISVLSQRAAEEALRVEAMACVDVLPPMPFFKHAFHQCATCSAPATTRCSKCKSARYCSGKCQIIHWRRGHKEKCLQLHDNGLSSSVGMFSVDAVQQMASTNNLDLHLLGSDHEVSVHGNIVDDVSDDLSSWTADKSDGSGTRTNLSGKRGFNKLNQDIPHENATLYASDETFSYGVDGYTLLSPFPLKDASLGNKILIGDFANFGNNRDNQDPGSYAVEDGVHTPYKCPSEKRNLSRPSSLHGKTNLDDGIIGQSESSDFMISDTIDSCELVEPAEQNYSAEKCSSKGRVMYKEPPYSLGQTVLMSQRTQGKALKEPNCEAGERSFYKKYESRASRTNIFSNDHVPTTNGMSNIGGSKVESSKSPAKILKCNLVGLINDNRKNKVLFPYEDLVKFFQYDVRGISPRGLLNCGNSCYANAVLQCLSFTKPLMIYLLQRLHSKICCAKNWCLMCELEQHVSMLREGGEPLSPSRILTNMWNVGCRLGDGSQEDAHEFLRFLVMSMQSACLEGMGGEKEVDPRLQETTLIQQLFGGRLKSKVKCLNCYHESERYENIMDLTLEIHGWVESLEDALTQFTAPEDLDGENMYRCGRCSAYVKAKKQLSVHEVPNILTIVLKRFQTGKYGKINKYITFPEMLDMIPFVTGTADKPPLYLLYAVVVHLDTQNASFTGHYISYVKDMRGTWLRIDDSQVQAVPVGQVMSEGAYMLFYSRSFPRPPRIYTEKALLHPLCSTKRSPSRNPKLPKHEKQKQTGTLFASEDLISGMYDFTPEHGRGVEDQVPEFVARSQTSRHANDRFADSLCTDFSDATSSEWSLFTSSDESSFTTESTRDSFSAVDYEDNASLDSIASIFGSFYRPEYSQSNAEPYTKRSSCRSETRYFSGSTGHVLDSSMPTGSRGSVHRGSNLHQASCASSAEPGAFAGNRSLYG